MRDGDIAASVLDQAFYWAVRLNSGVTTDSERVEFQQWLQASDLHRQAWQRIGVVDREFAAARAVGSEGKRVLDRLATRRRVGRQKSVVSTLLVLVVLPGLLFSAWHQLWQPQFSTGRGELHQIVLDGGARIHLDAETDLDLETEGGRTTLQLHRGRVLVDSGAAAMQDKPLIVTGHGRFAPIGTRFVVAEQDEATELAVLQGVVSIDEVHRVNAGELRRVSTQGVEVAKGDGLMRGAWADGVVEADDARLDVLLAELGRHRRGWLRCDPAVAALRVTGVFRLGDTDGALQALEQSLPVRIERTAAWWVSVRAR